MTSDELASILAKHSAWLRGEPDGERAGLCAILQRAIESISEEWSCATWHMGIEYHLWRIITQGGGGLSETEAAGLRAMSHLIGGWLWWPEAAAAPQFIALDDWQREYERFSKPTPTEPRLETGTAVEAAKDGKEPTK